MTVETLTPAEGVEKLLAVGNPPEDPQNTPPEKQDDNESLETDQDNEVDDAPDPDEGEGAEDAEDDDAPDGDDDDGTPEPLYTVKIDGKEKQVNLKELVAGYQRGKDYANKTGQLAEERRQIEQIRTEANQRRDLFAAQLTSLEKILSQEDPDLQQLKQKDPSRYLLIKSEREEALKRVQAEQAKIRAQYEADQRAAMVKRTQEERERLLAVLPSWRDPQKATQEAKEIATYAKGLGFSEQEIGGLSDHRALIALRKAWLYDKGRSLKGKQDKQAKPSLPPGKPQSRVELKGRDRDRAMERLKREGSVQAGVAALLARKN